MRRNLNEDVRLIMEELQGANVATQQPLPTPGKPVPGMKPNAKAGQPAQQVAQGVQQVANQAAQGAAAAGDQKLQAQMAAQQGTDPAHQEQVNKINAVQPRPTKLTASAQARDQKNDALDGRKAAQQGVNVQAAEEFNSLDKLIGEDEVTTEPAADDAANPDDKDGFNDDAAEDRPAQRAKEVFPGAKDNKAAGYGKKGAGRGQCHHEITHPGQRTPRSTEKNEGVTETVTTEAERASLLDGVFGA
jgi:hypothetical protein